MDTPTPAPDRQESARVVWSQRLLWLIGGFDPITLAQPRCQAVRPKYSCMGALVLLTALIATCSGGYALYTVFRDARVTWVVGALWGLLILTLDRFLVSSTRKWAVAKDFNKEPNALPPYAHRSPWYALSIRLPLATLIGLAVSVPIEARLLQPWIHEYERARYETRSHDLENNPAVIRLRDDIKTLETRVQSKNLEVEQTRQAASVEADGTGGSQHRGLKEIWAQKNQYYLSAQSELDTLNAQLTQAKQQFADERGRLSKTVENDAAARQQERSIISDIAVIHELASDPSPRGTLVRWVSGFLTLLFVLIECIPVLAKALSPFDPYDATVQELEHDGILDSLVETRRKYAEASLSE